MISAMTSPGTEVVALRDAPPEKGLPGVARGGVYFVERIVEAADGEAFSFCVVLVGHGLGAAAEPRPWWANWRPKIIDEWGYSPNLFRYLDRAASIEFYALSAPARDVVFPSTKAGR